MMGKSHRLGGALAMLGTFEYMRYNGMLLPDLHPLMQLAIMYPASAFGAVVPDVDHHKGSNPVNTPAGEIFHWAVHFPTRLNKRFNMKQVGVITDPESGKTKPKLKARVDWIDKLVPLKHRAWQTHSILVTGSALFFLWALVTYLATQYNTIDTTLLRMIVFGFIVGVVSHLILDAMTTDGIYILMYKKIRIVPNNPIFKAGGTFETVVFKRVATAIFWAVTFIMIANATGKVDVWEATGKVIEKGYALFITST